MSDFLTQTLPADIVPPSIDAARCILCYGDFKIGKSAISSWLSQNRSALWLDYEDGGEALPGRKINVIRAAQAAGMKKIDFLLKLWSELAKEPTPRFQYLIHDKINQLEDWAESWATALYKNTVIGRNFNGRSVLELPEGGGYRYLRECFLDIWNAASAAAPRQLWWCSQRLKFIGTDQGKFECADLDLTGKCRAIAAGSADAPCVMFRAEDGANYVSFQTKSKQAFCGCRVPRLEGKVLKLSWIENGELKVDWNQLYPDGK